jgi:sporulation and spore germination protein
VSVPAVRPTRSGPLALLAALAVLGLALVVGCRGGGKDQPAQEGEGAASAEATEEAPARDESEPSIDPLPRRNVDIYFPSTVEDGLVAESREIFDTATAGDQVKQIVNDLLSDPTHEKARRAVPAGTRLRQVYVLDEGVAWLDFSSDLTDNLPGGSMSELLTVYAIVDSVVANVQNVRRVGILIEGHQVETLNGHLSLKQPLKPNYSMVLDAKQAEGPAPTEDDELALPTTETPAD